MNLPSFKLVSQVELLNEKLGFDDAFNYKEETDLNSTLKRSGSSILICMDALTTFFSRVLG